MKVSVDTYILAITSILAAIIGALIQKYRIKLGPSKSLQCVWKIPPPSSEDILKLPRNNIVLLGTSNIRFVNQDMDKYIEWLKKFESRKLIVLFLNPNSPHANNRKRLSVVRSQKNTITKALKDTFEKSFECEQIIPLIYEGPYRYSARAIDIGKDKEESSSYIYKFTTTHQKGISSGFWISILRKENREIFDFYKEDLFYLIKSAYTNIPGHGISLVWKNDRNIINLNNISFHEQNLTEHNDIFLFNSNQIHLTICSIYRSQENQWEQPLSVNDNSLPSNFYQLLEKQIQEIYKKIKKPISIILDTLYIDNNGFLYLTNQNSINFSILDNLIRSFEVTANRFVDDKSNNINIEDKVRFFPKHKKFKPYVCIGRRFKTSEGIVQPKLNSEPFHKINNKITIELTELSIVHYAYKSLLRNIGSIDIPFENKNMIDKNLITQLGVS